MVKCKWMYYMKPSMEAGMKYSELVESGATKKQRQEFLTDGDMAIVTIRIPQNLKDAATEAASLKGIGFSAYARMCILDSLANSKQ